MATDNTTKTINSEDRAISAAFGAKNRARLIGEYLDGEAPLAAGTAWEHVYSLLLWIDQTTGLAHCYESDKCQPGKPWYGRSLAFHGWAASALRTTPAGLADRIDLLFRKATSDLAATVLKRAAQLEKHGEKQRRPYEASGFPRPGEDPELVSIVRSVLGHHLSREPTKDQWQLLVQKIRKYVMSENKRRNLVGEGFEDVLATIMNRLPATSSLDVRVRKALHELPGFGPPKTGDKLNKVDMAIVHPRTLVTVKWSLRADRERQFQSDYAAYVDAETSRKPWEYVFVTNEFDPARLMRACEQLEGHTHMFARVVHINTAALRATYAGPPPDPELPPVPGKRSKPPRPEAVGKTDKSVASIEKVLGYIDSGRLISLGEWLTSLPL